MEAEVSDPKPKQVIAAEAIAAEVDALMQFAAERGRVAAQTGRRPGKAAGPVRTRRSDKPDISALLREDLMTELAQGVVTSVEPEAHGGLLDWEIQREVVKKALMNLGQARLRQIAKELRLDRRGKVEALAERVARAYRYDNHDIAQLILDNEEEPEPDRGHVDRLYPLVEPLDVASVEQRIDSVRGRFIRVGVARWFVFSDLERRSETRLHVNGTLHTYRAYVVREEEEGDDDATVEVAVLQATPTITPIEIVVVDGATTLRVSGVGVYQSRSAAHAFESVTGTELRGSLPLDPGPTEGVLGTFAWSTVFMLELLQNRLPDEGLTERNVTVARFQMDSTVREETDEDDARPALREVRFEGAWLADSVPACRFIAIEGRGLVDLSLRVAADGADDDDPRYPVRVAIERDHVLVLTGFGRREPEGSVQLHSRLVRAVGRAIDEGVSHHTRLMRLAERMAERAASGADVERATMLDEDDEFDES